MDIISQKLKNIIEKSGFGTKFVIVENGEPQYVLMKFEEYERILDQKKSLKSMTESELVGKINDDIAFWKESQQEKKAEKEEMLLDDIEKLEDFQYVKSEVSA